MTEAGNAPETGARAVRIALTADDLQAAYRLFLTRAILKTRPLFYLALTALAVGVGTTVAVKALTGDDLPPLVALLLAIAAPLARVWWAYRQHDLTARRIFGQQQSLHLPFTLSWDDEGMATQSDQGNARLPWLYVLRVLEDKQLILVFESDSLYRLLPRRFLTPAQQEDLLACAHAGIAGTAREAA